MVLGEFEDKSITLTANSERLFGGRGDVQFNTLEVMDIPMDDVVAAPSIGVGVEARGEVAAEARYVDDVGHFVAFAEHVAGHHVLGFVSDIIGDG